MKRPARRPPSPLRNSYTPNSDQGSFSGSEIDDDDDDLTAGGRPLEPSDSFDVIGEDEDVSSKLVFSRRR